MLEENSFEKRSASFYFYFIGKEKTKKIDYEKLEDLIDKCFDKFKTYDDMIRNVAWIRTILADFDETYLEIETGKVNSGNEQSILYRDKKIEKYKSEQKLEETNQKFELSYELGKGIQFSISDNNGEVLEYENQEDMIELIDKNLKNLEKLNKITPINLDQESKIICEIYKLFYNEYPDFSKEDINIKIQSMMSILEGFGISISDDISFTMNYNKFPISLYLKQNIENLTPLGKIESIIEPVKLAEYPTKIIKIVSESIREFIPEDYDEAEVLPRISSIIYTKIHMVSSRASANEVSKVSTRPENAVKEVLKLVKKINNQIKNI